jgi:hypothetical protein
MTIRHYQRNVHKWSRTRCPLSSDTSILGEWLALPLAGASRSEHIGDEAFNEIFHPIAVRFSKSAMWCCASDPAREP